MAERYARRPGDADVKAGRDLRPAGESKVAPARRSAANEDGVVPFLEQPSQALYRPAEPQLRHETDDVADLLVEHAFRQPELGDLRAHHPARPRVLVVEDHLVAERQEIARDRERCRTGAYERDTFAVLDHRRPRQQRPDVPLVVGSDALQPADRDRFGLDATTSARGLARAVAGPAEHPRE